MEAGVMSAGEPFASAVAALSSALELSTSMCEPFLRVFPIAGASISTLGAPFGNETICASDQTVAHLDEVQIDLGEGPCWDAQRNARPILSANLIEDSRVSWPIFAEAVRESGAASIYAFPLMVGPLSIGALDLYSTESRAFTEKQVADATELAAIVARQVLRQSLSSRETDRENPFIYAAEHSRRVVDQATGMVLAQLDVSATDALLLIRAHAFANGRSVREIATEIVERRLSLA